MIVNSTYAFSKNKKSSGYFFSTHITLSLTVIPLVAHVSTINLKTFNFSIIGSKLSIEPM